VVCILYVLRFDHALPGLLKCHLPNQPRSREGTGMLVLRSMDPRASTAKIFSTFQKSVSLHSSCSLTRTPIAQLRLRSPPPAPTSMELWNKVSRGSRRKQLPPKCEFISYFMYLFAQRQSIVQRWQTHCVQLLWSCLSRQHWRFRPFQ
jgi:hypothetical protein